MFDYCLYTKLDPTEGKRRHELSFRTVFGDLEGGRYCSDLFAAMKLHFLQFGLTALLLMLNVITGNRVIRVVPDTEADVQFLQKLQDHEEVDFWSHAAIRGSAVDIHVTDVAYAKLAPLLKTAGLEFSIAIADVEAALRREKRSHIAGIQAPASWYSHYHPLNEIEQELKNIANQYSRMVSLFSIGRSYERRLQYAVQLRGRPRPNKPLFFMNCGIHAREWVSPATCMYIVKQIVSRYDKEHGVTAMLDKMDFVVLPVLNVDGYVYTWKSHRFWRKTRKPNMNSNCVGTDPNRNWDYKWGLPGASSDPCSNSYRGTHPFSEVEILNVANYLKSEGSRVAGYMDVHSYSQLWMIPWGYTRMPTNDNEELIRVSKIAVKAIQKAGFNTVYRYGPSSVIIYQNSGGSKDYTYGSLGIKYSFAVELRDKGTHGFLLPSSQIVPTGLEIFHGLLAMVDAMKV